MRDLTGKKPLLRNQQFEGMSSAVEWKTVNLTADAREKFVQFKDSSAGRKLDAAADDIERMTKDFSWDSFSSGLFNNLEEWAVGVYDFFSPSRWSLPFPPSAEPFSNGPPSTSKKYSDAGQSGGPPQNERPVDVARPDSQTI